VYVTNKGNMQVFDVRKNNKVLSSIKAHNSRANDIKIGKKNLCYTCSEDENVRVWNLHDLSHPIASKNPKCVNITRFRVFYCA
jgi:WD40 repeat protein